jgi:hypothetical protein
MPANVVKPGQEKYWERAKEQAAKQGRAEDWAYVMGIFQKMVTNKSMEKSGYPHDALAARMRRWPGQVPSREQREILKLAQMKPSRQPVTPEGLWSGRPVMRVDKVVDNIGLDVAQQESYRKLLSEIIPASNELSLRQRLMSVMRQDRLDPVQRKEMMSRALSFQRHALQKGAVMVSGIEDLEKAGPYIGPKGGKWADTRHTIPWKDHGYDGPKVNTKKLLQGSFGIKRIDMPQIKSTLVPQFIDELKESGVSVTRGEVEVGGLKATQNELHEGKVQAMIKNPDVRKNLAKPVIVSSDGYLLDGHHRWAAMATMDPKSKVPTVKVDLPMKKLLDKALNFSGVEFKKAGPYIGPKGGKWADAKRTIPWKEGQGKAGKVVIQDVRTLKKVPAGTAAELDKLEVGTKIAAYIKSGEGMTDNWVSLKKEKSGQWTAQRYAKGRLPASKSVSSKDAAALVQAYKGAREIWEPRPEDKDFDDQGNYIGPEDYESFDLWDKTTWKKSMGPRGGKYHRRVPKADGKGYTYYYDEEKYNRSKNAHVSGKGASRQAIKSAVQKQMESAGDGGVSLEDLKSLVTRYGSKLVGEVLEKEKSEGRMKFEKGRLSLAK